MGRQRTLPSGKHCQGVKSINVLYLSVRVAVCFLLPLLRVVSRALSIATLVPRIETIWQLLANLLRTLDKYLPTGLSRFAASARLPAQGAGPEVFLQF